MKYSKIFKDIDLIKYSKKKEWCRLSEAACYSNTEDCTVIFANNSQDLQKVQHYVACGGYAMPVWN